MPTALLPLRTYSKAVAGGNHIIWTGRQVIPAAFFLAGLPGENAEFGLLRVPSSTLGMYCTGFRVDFQVPPASAQLALRIDLCTGAGAVVPGGSLYLNGVVGGGELTLARVLPMPPNSLWKFVCHVPANLTLDQTKGLPESLSATYWLQPAGGAAPVRSDAYSTRGSLQGIGYDVIGQTLQVQ